MDKVLLKELDDSQINSMATALLETCHAYMESSGIEYLQELIGCTDEECEAILRIATERLKRA